MSIGYLLHLFSKYCVKTWEKAFAIHYRNSLLGSCGKNVRIGRRTKAEGWKNIYIGNNVSIGVNTVFLTTRAKIIIHDHVIFGPGVTIITGNHRTDIVGKFIDQIIDADKLQENDEDVVLEGDNWIGANTMIMKGVTIGRGAIVAAGAIVTKSVEPYEIVGGIPAKRISWRFQKEDVKKHEIALYGKVLTAERE